LPFPYNFTKKEGFNSFKGFHLASWVEQSIQNCESGVKALS
jgi:hypothetical protein